MSLFRLVGVLTFVAASLWLEPSAYAICVDDETCAPCRVCVNYQCVQPSCVPSGCIDDVLYRTHCCSGAAVPGSTFCTNPADWGTTWASCYQTCA